MTKSTRAPLAALLVASLAGCGLEPLDAGHAAPCSEARRLSSGACCPAWSRAEGGRCEARSFTAPPSKGEGVGEGVARVVELAIDASDRALAAWQGVGDDGVPRAIVAEEQEGAPFGVREPSAALAGAGDMLDVAAGPDGSAVVVWRQTESESGRIFASERSAAREWADPADASDAFSFLPTAYEPRLAQRGSGEALLVWNQWMSTGYGVLVARRASSGAPWELPLSAEDVLSPRQFFSNAPQIAVNEQGSALVTWYQSTGGPLLVRASERLGEGAEFSRPSAEDVISPPGAPVDSHPIANPMPAVGPNGEAAIAWTQEDGKGAIPIYLATRSPEGVWQKPADLGDSFSVAVGVARCAQVRFDPEGTLYVVWYQNEGTGDRVYAARRAAGGAWLEGGRAPVTLSTEGAIGVTPSLAVGLGGAALVAWTERPAADSPDDPPRRWRAAARRTGPGEAWGPVEILSSDDAGDVESPAAGIGGARDRAVVAWAQGDLFKRPVFFARVE